MKKQPQLTLVGAGPGDPDLITIKGVKALQSADVVLYDALAHPELLDHAPETALKIYVGKRVGKHSHRQESIHQLIVQHAFNYGHVVRLKGGDPFVFARGQEEIEYAETFGIETAVVPGITSATSVPALQKIPVTRRGSSESFWVITATTKTGQLSRDIEIAAQSTATLVILMGTSKLKQIVDIFRKQGREDVPVAVIQNGSLPEERSVVGTIDNIHKKVVEEKISSPAIIVIGEVVNYHPQLNLQMIDKTYLKSA